METDLSRFVSVVKYCEKLEIEFLGLKTRWRSGDKAIEVP